MALESAKKVTLNRITHSVRASQAVLQYGVGAMVDFPNQTLMTAAPEYWQEQVVQIHDERLERVLHVDYFGLPGGQDDPQCREGISYVRFPEWYFCPKCRKFQSIKKWVKEYKSKAKAHQLVTDPDMIKFVKCPTCRQDLVVTRIVTACSCGHIDDFPWVKWVHCQNAYGGPKQICDHPSLTFKTSASSTEGLEGLSVECKTCGAKATLKGAFDNGKFEELDRKYENRYNFRCAGRHPWKNTREKCTKYPKVLQRGSSSVYFPITASSLVIPPYSSLLTKKIEGSSAFSKYKDVISEYKKIPFISNELLSTLIQGSIEGCIKDVSLEIGVGVEKVRPILERKWIAPLPEEEYSTLSVKYRSEEYEALSGEVALPSDDYGDFLRESTNIENYAIPHIKNISLIHKIREVQALTGFSRLKPIEQIEINGESEKAVLIKQLDTNWFPAYEVRGEGIFIEFAEADISKWLRDTKALEHRVDILNENYKKSYIGSGRPREVTAKFLLLHTISHLLIKQLSFECGYSIASLKERVYCSEISNGKQMAGILIYTASGDSEGTMGGLVRQGRSDTFPGVFRKAIESAMTCSNDPVCSLSTGQGRDSLNLSACYSCSLIPETSCEEFNIFLDRATVVGTYENRNIGFYYRQLYGGESWRKTDQIPTTDTQYVGKTEIKAVVGQGLDLKDSSYKDIWRSLQDWSDDDSEIELLIKLQNESHQFSSKEKPQKDCIFYVSKRNDQFNCDLYWVNSKVAFFCIDNQESYLVAKNTDLTCFFSGDPSLTVNEILSAIKEK